MGLFTRFLRQKPPPEPEAPVSSSSEPSDSPVDQRGNDSEQPSSPNRLSKDSEGYPSWLPKRPPPPAPASTFHSSVGMLPEAGPSDQPFAGGRRQTPRSVRIASLQHDSGYTEKDRREPTDQTRVPSGPVQSRAWSRATGAVVSPAAPITDPRQAFQPRFRARGLHIELLRNPSAISRAYFYLFQIFIFAHIPLQTYFDFNAVFVLILVAKDPNPIAPGVPGRGSNWALGAAAYIACWFVWLFGVFIVYELVYSFARRWRTKRPLMAQIYLSTPAFNFVAISSYTNFCFLQHIRYSAFQGDLGSIRDGLAETFYFYSQNWPTVGLLLPRAGLSLAVLLTFSSSNADLAALEDSGMQARDGTFFRNDGALTDYARGVLIANAAWTAWKIILLLCSWIGLWVTSGQGCGGLCGPRYRWEEDDAEKRMSIYSDNLSEADDILPWNWRECTMLRVQTAFDFCQTVRPVLGKARRDISGYSDRPAENVDQILAAVGLGSSPPPASRRGVLADDFFQGPHGETLIPRTETPPELSSIIPKVVKRSDAAAAGSSAPLMSLPYPFTMQGAQLSSADKVPFPPSPVPSHDIPTDPTSESPGDEEEGTEDEEEGIDDDDGYDETGILDTSEDPSSGRTSGSMSSLGHPLSSRYPFQIRRPGGRGASSSSGAASHMSHMTPPSNSTNSRSMGSRMSQSTGNRESTDSQSPKSHYTTSSDAASPRSHRSSDGMPMPPRHPRARAGTVPTPSSPGSPSPVAFPRTGRSRVRVESDISITQAFGPPQRAGGLDVPDVEMMEQPEPEGSIEEGEGDDVLGLLSDSTGPSPRQSLTGLRQLSSALSLHRSRHGSHSGSNSRTNSNSGSSSRSRAGSLSIPVSVRSRAQSLMQNIGSASRSSIELVQGVVRSRASSMARLEDELYSSDAKTHSRSTSSSEPISNPENHTFGHPSRPWQLQEAVQEESIHDSRPSSRQSRSGDIPAQEPQYQSQAQERPESVTIQLPPLSPTHSRQTLALAPSESDITTGTHDTERRDNSAGDQSLHVPELSHAPTESSFRTGLSTANPSFVTAPLSVEGTTDESQRTVSSYGGEFRHMVERSDSTWRPM